MARWANSCSPAVMERCFVVSSMTQMVAGKADCSHCSIVSPNNSGVRLFWTSQLTSHCVIYWTGGALFSWWMAIDSRYQLSIIAAVTDLMVPALGRSKTHTPWVVKGRPNFTQHTRACIQMRLHARKHLWRVWRRSYAPAGDTISSFYASAMHL